MHQAEIEALHRTASSSLKLAIETRALRKVYGEGNTEVIAMQDASVSVRQGEVVALAWPQRFGQVHFSDGHWADQSTHQRTNLDRW